jgi:zona occludens toxin (predicted ATPase)
VVFLRIWKQGILLHPKFLKNQFKNRKMKKLFALLIVASTFAMYSCGGGEKTEEHSDSTATSTEMSPAPEDSSAAAAAPADSAAAAPAAAH